jgi:hypothetical protein
MITRKSLWPLWLTFFLGLLLAGCGTQLALSGKAREDYLKSIKAYGEYWTKPGMTTESWRQDWVACGGRSNGQYSGNLPPGSTTAVLLAEDKKLREELGFCMQSKGYEYPDTAPDYWRLKSSH